MHISCASLALVCVPSASTFVRLVTRYVVFYRHPRVHEHGCFVARALYRDRRGGVWCCGGLHKLLASGVVRSRFAQVGGALLVGVAGRTHQHTKILDSSGVF